MTKTKTLAFALSSAVAFLAAGSGLLLAKAEPTTTDQMWDRLASILAKSRDFNQQDVDDVHLLAVGFEESDTGTGATSSATYPEGQVALILDHGHIVPLVASSQNSVEILSVTPEHIFLEAGAPGLCSVDLYDVTRADHVVHHRSEDGCIRSMFGQDAIVRTHGAGVFIEDATTGKVQASTISPNGKDVLSLSVSPDARSIAYDDLDHATLDGSLLYNVYIWDAQLDKQTLIGTYLVEATEGPSAPASVTWLDDSTVQVSDPSGTVPAATFTIPQENNT